MKFSPSAQQRISRCVAVLLALLLLGCPQTMVRRIEQMLPPPNWRPLAADTLTEISADTLLSRAERGNTAAMTPAGSVTPQELGSPARAAVDDSVTADTVTFSLRHSGCLVELQPRQLDDRNYPRQIVFDVVVTDTAGRFVTGLAPPNYRGAVPWRQLWFSLSDSCGGRRVDVDSFTVEQLRAERSERFAVAFVLDHSPSMGSVRIMRLRQAVAGVLKEFIAGDAATIISFGGRAVVEIPITADSSVYRSFDPAAGRMISGTAIYDAVDVALEQLRKVPKEYQRIIVLFTDGEDNSSKLSLQQAVRHALGNGAVIYTIGYGMIAEEPLRLLAQGTRGQMYRIYSVREFPAVFARIYRALRSYYRIRYRPPECAGLHTVRVGLRFAGCTTATAATYDRSILSSLDTVGTMVFLPIEFDYDQATIRPESLQLLEQVANAMKAHPALRIEVRGHTDDRGSDEYNLRLSQRRAEAVVEALVKMGVERSRLRAVGYGKSRPLVPNTSEENRARNRRTEFVIINN